MSSSTPVTIAIDGPSGSGKSSVSRAVAQRLGLSFLDTGAMYRAVTWWCLERDVDLADHVVVGQVARDLSLRMGTDPAAPAVHVGDTDITTAIRDPRIATHVSAVATNLEVRAALVRRQRGEIAAARADGGMVAEGRDITTVVAPDAEVRILLTATEEARLARRTREVHGSLDEAAQEATRDQVLRRDQDDATVSAFFQPADGVVGIDTSALTFDQAVQAVLDVARAAPATDDERTGTPR